MFRKLESMMMDPMIDEGFYRAMMGFFASWNIEMLKKVVAAGADSIELGGNLVTSGAGPDFFKNFVTGVREHAGAPDPPRTAHSWSTTTAATRRRSCTCTMTWTSTAGATSPAQPFGDVVLDDALRIIRPDMALRGNIDQVEFLREATPAEIRERVRMLLEKVKPRGNWILSTSDFFFDGNSYDNIHALAKAGRDFGRY